MGRAARITSSDAHARQHRLTRTRSIFRSCDACVAHFSLPAEALRDASVVVVVLTGAD
jgi:hypothetical protein